MADYRLTLAPELAKYREFPKEVRDWIVNATRAKVRSEFLGRLQESPQGMISDLDGFFRLMRRILDCDNKSLMRGTGFDSADLDPERFHAMLAELRGVGFLHDQGFVGLKLLPATPKRRGADIIGSLGNTRFAVEVLCSSRSAYRWPGHKRRSSDLIEWIVDRYLEKVGQLNQTAAEESCARRALVVVLDSRLAKDTETRLEYAQVLGQVWHRLAQPQNTHLALVTGRVACFGFGLDDCVFPPWAGNP
jgi:hypothetical protein